MQQDPKKTKKGRRKKVTVSFVAEILAWKLPQRLLLFQHKMVFSSSVDNGWDNTEVFSFVKKIFFCFTLDRF